MYIERKNRRLHKLRLSLDEQALSDVYPVPKINANSNNIALRKSLEEMPIASVSSVSG